MKCSLLSIAMVVATAPVCAQSLSNIAASVPEPSTLSLIAAGVIALGMARRQADKAEKS